MTKEEILDYVMNSPENTNRRVLSDMLNELTNSSGGGPTVRIVDIVWDDSSGEPTGLSMSYNDILDAVWDNEEIILLRTEYCDMPISQMPGGGDYPIVFSGGVYFSNYNSSWYANVDGWEYKSDGSLQFRRVSWAVEAHT